MVPIPPPGRGVLPYVGQYYLNLLWPPFFNESYTQWPRFPLQSTPNDPLLFKISNILSIFTWKRRIIFTQIWQNLHRMIPYLHQKGHFLKVPHPMTPPPFFSTKSYAEYPLSSFTAGHIPVTFIFNPLPRYSPKLVCKHSAIVAWSKVGYIGTKLILDNFVFRYHRLH